MSNLNKHMSYARGEKADRGKELGYLACRAHVATFVHIVCRCRICTPVCETTTGAQTHGLRWTSMRSHSASGGDGGGAGGGAGGECSLHKGLVGSVILQKLRRWEGPFISFGLGSDAVGIDLKLTATAPVALSLAKHI